MTNKFKKIAIALAAQAAALAIPAAALAQGDSVGNLVPNSLTVQTNPLLVVKGIIQFILVIAFVLAFLLLLIGGVRWITSGGDEKGVASARNTITAALIGLVIVLLAYAIIRLVELFFGVNIVSGTVTIPTIPTS